MFDLAPCDEEFFVSAPDQYSFTLDLPVPAARVWEGLSNATPLSWCRALSGGRYTSAPPHHVGTTREIKALGLLHLKEEFFRWDEGVRHSFWVTQSNLPLFHRFAEDYLVEPTADGCRFTWSFASEPVKGLSWPSGLAAMPNRALYKSLEFDTRRHFTRSAKAH